MNEIVPIPYHCERPLDVDALEQVPEEIIATLPAPFDLIARWWAFVPPAILLNLDRTFIRRNRRREVGLELRAIDGADFPEVGRDFYVPYDLFYKTWQHGMDVFNSHHLPQKRSAEEYRKKLAVLFFDQEGEPLQIEEFTACVRACESANARGHCCGSSKAV